MDRRKFFTTGSRAGAAACAAICFGGADKCLASIMPESNETSCDDKVKFAQTWIKRFMDVVDSGLDKETKLKIMHENGKNCYLGSMTEAGVNPETIPKMSPEDFVKSINGYAGEEAAVIKDNTIEFCYTKNPKGLKVKDGYCLCPLVEKGPEGLSGTYCECSVGYVSVMFSSFLKQPVKVELLESLKRGGKTCRFKVTLT